MAKITITGASDDLIEIHGDLAEEFQAYQGGGEEFHLIAVGDGTLLRARYDGIWRFTPMAHGTAKYSKVEGTEEADTNDIVTLEGDIKWVTVAENGTWVAGKGTESRT